MAIKLKKAELEGELAVVRIEAQFWSEIARALLNEEKPFRVRAVEHPDFEPGESLTFTLWHPERSHGGLVLITHIVDGDKSYSLDTLDNVSHRFGGLSAPYHDSAAQWLYNQRAELYRSLTQQH